jgi:SpoVK/Ycf46/Vps4 family AAA+-type ATPase
MCKALAHKLAIRLSNLYESSILIEIHSHSLFSKWFSESGKLVARLFEHITELVEEPGVLVFVLIDEVESLTTARSNSGSEPSDAVRVVNAMLTQLDRLKRHPNVLTLCTTNLASSIDAAFVDRADIKAYIGLPPVAARYTIFRDCVLELTRVCLIAPAVEIRVVPDAVTSEIEATLLATAQAAEGLSGRTLRKLPFLAHATYIQQSEPCTTLEFTRALQCAVADELAARSILASDGMASSSGEGCSSGSGGGGGGCHVGGEPQGFIGGGSDP